MENKNSQVAGGASLAGVSGPCLATETGPKIEVIEFGVGRKLYRERDRDVLRIVHLRIDPHDQANCSMRAVEIDGGDVLRIYDKWSYPWDWGTRVLVEVRLEPANAEKVRNYLARIRTRRDFDEVACWLLTARYLTTRSGAIIYNGFGEPKM